jgi:hypothetical protein
MGARTRGDPSCNWSLPGCWDGCRLQVRANRRQSADHGRHYGCGARTPDAHRTAVPDVQAEGDPVTDGDPFAIGVGDRVRRSAQHGAAVAVTLDVNRVGGGH